MFGLCLPSGETKLFLKDGTNQSIAFTDESKPKKYILEDKHILSWVNKIGYKNIDCISYERNNKKTIVSIAEYYYENAKDLKD